MDNDEICLKDAEIEKCAFAMLGMQIPSEESVIWKTLATVSDHLNVHVSDQDQPSNSNGYSGEEPYLNEQSFYNGNSVNNSSANEGQGSADSGGKFNHVFFEVDLASHVCTDQESPDANEANYSEKCEAYEEADGVGDENCGESLDNVRSGPESVGVDHSNHEVYDNESSGINEGYVRRSDEYDNGSIIGDQNCGEIMESVSLSAETVGSLYSKQFSQNAPISPTLEEIGSGNSIAEVIVESDYDPFSFIDQDNPHLLSHFDSDNSGDDDVPPRNFSFDSNKNDSMGSGNISLREETENVTMNGNADHSDNKEMPQLVPATLDTPVRRIYANPPVLQPEQSDVNSRSHMRTLQVARVPPFNIVQSRKLASGKSAKIIEQRQESEDNNVLKYNSDLDQVEEPNADYSRLNGNSTCVSLTGKNSKSKKKIQAHSSSKNSKDKNSSGHDSIGVRRCPSPKYISPFKSKSRTEGLVDDFLRQSEVKNKPLNIRIPVTRSSAKKEVGSRKLLVKNNVSRNAGASSLAEHDYSALKPNVSMKSTRSSLVGLQKVEDIYNSNNDISSKKTEVSLTQSQDNILNIFSQDFPSRSVIVERINGIEINSHRSGSNPELDAFDTDSSIHSYIDGCSDGVGQGETLSNYDELDLYQCVLKTSDDFKLNDKTPIISSGNLLSKDGLNSHVESVSNETKTPEHGYAAPGLFSNTEGRLPSNRFGHAASSGGNSQHQLPPSNAARNAYLQSLPAITDGPSSSSHGVSVPESSLRHVSSISDSPLILPNSFQSQSLLHTSRPGPSHIADTRPSYSQPSTSTSKVSEPSASTSLVTTSRSRLPCGDKNLNNYSSPLPISSGNVAPISPSSTPPLSDPSELVLQLEKRLPDIQITHVPDPRMRVEIVYAETDQDTDISLPQPDEFMEMESSSSSPLPPTPVFPGENSQRGTSAPHISSPEKIAALAHSLESYANNYSNNKSLDQATGNVNHSTEGSGSSADGVSDKQNNFVHSHNSKSLDQQSGREPELDPSAVSDDMNEMVAYYLDEVTTTEHNETTNGDMTATLAKKCPSSEKAAASSEIDIHLTESVRRFKIVDELAVPIDLSIHTNRTEVNQRNENLNTDDYQSEKMLEDHNVVAEVEISAENNDNGKSCENNLALERFNLSAGDESLNVRYNLVSLTNRGDNESEESPEEVQGPVKEVVIDNVSSPVENVCQIIEPPISYESELPNHTLVINEETDVAHEPNLTQENHSVRPPVTSRPIINTSGDIRNKFVEESGSSKGNNNQQDELDKLSEVVTKPNGNLSLRNTESNITNRTSVGPAQLVSNPSVEEMRCNSSKPLGKRASRNSTRMPMTLPISIELEEEETVHPTEKNDEVDESLSSRSLSTRRLRSLRIAKQQNNSEINLVNSSNSANEQSHSSSEDSSAPTLAEEPSPTSKSVVRENCKSPKSLNLESNANEDSNSKNQEERDSSSNIRNCGNVSPKLLRRINGRAEATAFGFRLPPKNRPFPETFYSQERDKSKNSRESSAKDKTNVPPSNTDSGDPQNEPNSLASNISEPLEDFNEETPPIELDYSNGHGATCSTRSPIPSPNQEPFYKPTSVSSDSDVLPSCSYTPDEQASSFTNSVSFSNSTHLSNTKIRRNARISPSSLKPYSSKPSSSRFSIHHRIPIVPHSELEKHSGCKTRSYQSSSGTESESEEYNPYLKNIQPRSALNTRKSTLRKKPNNTFQPKMKSGYNYPSKLLENLPTTSSNSECPASEKITLIDLTLEDEEEEDEIENRFTNQLSSDDQSTSGTTQNSPGNNRKPSPPCLDEVIAEVMKNRNLFKEVKNSNTTTQGENNQSHSITSDPEHESISQDDQSSTIFSKEAGEKEISTSVDQQIVSLPAVINPLDTDISAEKNSGIHHSPEPEGVATNSSGENESLISSTEPSSDAFETEKHASYDVNVIIPSGSEEIVLTPDINYPQTDKSEENTGIPCGPVNACSDRADTDLSEGISVAEAGEISIGTDTNLFPEQSVKESTCGSEASVISQKENHIQTVSSENIAIKLNETELHSLTENVNTGSPDINLPQTDIFANENSGLSRVPVHEDVTSVDPKFKGVVTNASVEIDIHTNEIPSSLCSISEVPGVSLETQERASYHDNAINPTGTEEILDVPDINHPRTDISSEDNTGISRTPEVENVTSVDPEYKGIVIISSAEIVENSNKNVSLLSLITEGPGVRLETADSVSYNENSVNPYVNEEIVAGHVENTGMLIAPEPGDVCTGEGSSSDIVPIIEDNAAIPLPSDKGSILLSESEGRSVTLDEHEISSGVDAKLSQEKSVEESICGIEASAVSQLENQIQSVSSEHTTIQAIETELYSSAENVNVVVSDVNLPQTDRVLIIEENAALQIPSDKGSMVLPESEGRSVILDEHEISIGVGTNLSQQKSVEESICGSEASTVSQLENKIQTVSSENDISMANDIEHYSSAENVNVSVHDVNRPQADISADNNTAVDEHELLSGVDANLSHQKSVEESICGSEASAISHLENKIQSVSSENNNIVAIETELCSPAENVNVAVSDVDLSQTDIFADTKTGISHVTAQEDVCSGEDSFSDQVPIIEDNAALQIPSDERFMLLSESEGRCVTLDEHEISIRVDANLSQEKSVEESICGIEASAKSQLESQIQSVSSENNTFEAIETELCSSDKNVNVAVSDVNLPQADISAENKTGISHVTAPEDVCSGEDSSSDQVPIIEDNAALQIPSDKSSMLLSESEGRSVTLDEHEISSEVGAKISQEKSVEESICGSEASTVSQLENKIQSVSSENITIKLNETELHSLTENVDVAVSDVNHPQTDRVLIIEDNAALQIPSDKGSVLLSENEGRSVTYGEYEISGGADVPPYQDRSVDESICANEASVVSQKGNHIKTISSENSAIEPNETELSFSNGNMSLVVPDVNHLPQTDKCVDSGYKTVVTNIKENSNENASSPSFQSEVSEVCLLSEKRVLFESNVINPSKNVGYEGIVSVPVINHLPTDISAEGNTGISHASDYRNVCSVDREYKGEETTIANAFPQTDISAEENIGISCFSQPEDVISGRESGSRDDMKNNFPLEYKSGTANPNTFYAQSDKDTALKKDLNTFPTNDFEHQGDVDTCSLKQVDISYANKESETIYPILNMGEVITSEQGPVVQDNADLQISSNNGSTIFSQTEEIIVTLDESEISKEVDTITFRKESVKESLCGSGVSSVSLKETNIEAVSSEISPIETNETELSSSTEDARAASFSVDINKRSVPAVITSPALEKVEEGAFECGDSHLPQEELLSEASSEDTLVEVAHDHITPGTNDSHSESSETINTNRGGHSIPLPEIKSKETVSPQDRVNDSPLYSNDDRNSFVPTVIQPNDRLEKNISFNRAGTSPNENNINTSDHDISEPHFGLDRDFVMTKMPDNSDDCDGLDPNYLYARNTYKPRFPNAHKSKQSGSLRDFEEEPSRIIKLSINGEGKLRTPSDKKIETIDNIDENLTHFNSRDINREKLISDAQNNRSRTNEISIEPSLLNEDYIEKNSEVTCSESKQESDVIENISERNNLNLPQISDADSAINSFNNDKGSGNEISVRCDDTVDGNPISIPSYSGGLKLNNDRCDLESEIHSIICPRTEPKNIEVGDNGAESKVVYTSYSGKNVANSNEETSTPISPPEEPALPSLENNNIEPQNELTSYAQPEFRSHEEHNTTVVEDRANRVNNKRQMNEEVASSYKQLDKVGAKDNILNDKRKHTNAHTVSSAKNKIKKTISVVKSKRGDNLVGDCPSQKESSSQSVQDSTPIQKNQKPSKGENITSDSGPHSKKRRLNNILDVAEDTYDNGTGREENTTDYKKCFPTQTTSKLIKYKTRPGRPGPSMSSGKRGNAVENLTETNAFVPAGEGGMNTVKKSTEYCSMPILPDVEPQVMLDDVVNKLEELFSSSKLKVAHVPVSVYKGIFPGEVDSSLSDESFVAVYSKSFKRKRSDQEALITSVNLREDDESHQRITKRRKDREDGIRSSDCPVNLDSSRLDSSVFREGTLNSENDQTAQKKRKHRKRTEKRSSSRKQLCVVQELGSYHPYQGRISREQINFDAVNTTENVFENSENVSSNHSLSSDLNGMAENEISSHNTREIESTPQNETISTPPASYVNNHTHPYDEFYATYKENYLLGRHGDRDFFVGFHPCLAHGESVNLMFGGTPREREPSSCLHESISSTFYDRYLKKLSLMGHIPVLPNPIPGCNYPPSFRINSGGRALNSEHLGHKLAGQSLKGKSPRQETKSKSTTTKLRFPYTIPPVLPSRKHEVGRKAKKKPIVRFCCNGTRSCTPECRREQLKRYPLPWETSDVSPVDISLPGPSGLCSNRNIEPTYEEDLNNCTGRADCKCYSCQDSDDDDPNRR